MARHVVVKAFVGGCLHDGRQHAIVQVGVGKKCARPAICALLGSSKVGAVGEVGAAGDKQVAQGVGQRQIVKTGIAQGGGVAQQHPGGDRSLGICGVAQRKPKILADVGIEVELSLPRPAAWRPIAVATLEREATRNFVAGVTGWLRCGSAASMRALAPVAFVDNGIAGDDDDCQAGQGRCRIFDNGAQLPVEGALHRRAAAQQRQEDG